MFSMSGPEKGFKLPFVRKLMIVLSRHLAGVDTLTDSEMFVLKSWLLQQAELCTPGYFVTLEEADADPAEGSGSRFWAVVGKSPDREPVVWHPPLPWTLPQPQSSLF